MSAGKENGYNQMLLTEDREAHYADFCKLKTALNVDMMKCMKNSKNNRERIKLTNLSQTEVNLLWKQKESRIAYKHIGLGSPSC